MQLLKAFTRIAVSKALLTSEKQTIQMQNMSDIRSMYRMVIYNRYQLQSRDANTYLAIVHFHGLFHVPALPVHLVLILTLIVPRKGCLLLCKKTTYHYSLQ